MTLTKSGDRLPKCTACGSVAAKTLVTGTYECLACGNVYTFTASPDLSGKCGGCCGGCCGKEE
jgi:uncharacterized Zn finger protein